MATEVKTAEAKTAEAKTAEAKTAEGSKKPARKIDESPAPESRTEVYTPAAGSSVMIMTNDGPRRVRPGQQIALTQEQAAPIRSHLTQLSEGPTIEANPIKPAAKAK